MGLRSSKSASSSSSFSVKKKKTGGKQQSLKRNRKDSDNSDLDDDDCNLVTVPLDTTASDKRLSKAKELIASGRPISITLEATTEELKDEKKNTDGKAVWEDDAARAKWKEQLGLMRHFYDWEEIPLDFFIDTYVGGGGEAVRKRRLSLNLVSEPPPNAHKPVAAQPEEIRIVPRPIDHPSPLPHQRPAPADVPRQRAASVAVTGSHVPQASIAPPAGMVARAQNVQQFATILEVPSYAPAIASTPVAIATPVRVPPALPERPSNRTRAASVAIGESFPLPVAAAIQKQSHPQVPPAKASGSPTEEDMKRMSAAATPSKRLAGVIAHQQTRERSTSRSDPVATAIEQESRPRRASATSIDQVYGRLGKPGGAYDRFEMENPVLQGSPQTPQRRPTVSEKKPEQFKNMSPVIDPTHFATERRNTRTSVRKSTVEKPLFDHEDGRISTASTKLESKSSNNSRSRTMSDWM